MISKLKAFTIIIGIILTAFFPWFLIADDFPRNNETQTIQLIGGKKHQQSSAQRPELKNDIAVENFYCSKVQAKDGDIITVGFRVNNLGNTNINQVPYELNLTGVRRIGSGRGEIERYNHTLVSGVLKDISINSWEDYSRELNVPWNIDSSKIEEIRVEVGRKHSNLGYETASLPFSVTVQRRADLIVANLNKQGARSNLKGTPFSINFSIKNIGSRTSIPCRYEVEFQRYDPHTVGRGSLGPGTAPYMTIDVKQGRVPPLRPNQSMPVTIKFRIPKENKKEFRVTVNADSGFGMFEANEDNNRSSISWNTDHRQPRNRPRSH